MTRIEVATITVPMGGVATAFPRIDEFVRDDKALGRLVGAFTSEIGPLNRILVLREFEDDEEAAEERIRTITGGDPYGVSEIATGLSISVYVPFPFLPPIPSGEFGPYYEVRVYGMKPSGVRAVIDAWEGAVPARSEISPLTVAMYALDGATPRFMNIWPYPSLDERNAARGLAAQRGIWPPKGGPENLTTLESGIYLPADFSPLR